MDYVQVHNCSQKYTYKAAIKFESAAGGSSRVSNSFIGQGADGIGIHILNSKNISLINNTVADFAENGIWAQNSKSVVFDGNWVFKVVAVPNEEPKFIEFDVGKKDTGCFTIYQGVGNALVQNNRAAGCWHHGFKFIPQKCDEDNPDYKFVNNVAHTISGYGAIALNVGNDCTEVKDQWAYKVT